MSLPRNLRNEFGLEVEGSYSLCVGLPSGAAEPLGGATAARVVTAPISVEVVGSMEAVACGSGAGLFAGEWTSELKTSLRSRPAMLMGSLTGTPRS
jgi:hypothetical protein